MLTPCMWTGASPHTRHTSGEAESSGTAEPGTRAENPPTIPSSCVTRPPRLFTRDSAESVFGAASRTITGKVSEGWATDCAYSEGSALAGAAGAPWAGGWMNRAATSSTTPVPITRVHLTACRTVHFTARRTVQPLTGTAHASVIARLLLRPVDPFPPVHELSHWTRPQ